MRLYLASTSPRRRAILRGLGIPFTLLRPSSDENAGPGKPTPRQLAVRHAGDKARSAAPQARSGIVVGVDTIVTINGLVLGKPRTPAQARAMLRRLSGRAHAVLTAVSVLSVDRDQQQTAVERTRVTFRDLSDREIDTYLAGTEPYDKAGAYGIQGRAGTFVARINGSYLNIVGLPVCLLLSLLSGLGWVGRVRGS